jgi:hypothetical protein
MTRDADNVRFEHRAHVARFVVFAAIIAGLLIYLFIWGPRPQALGPTDPDEVGSRFLYAVASGDRNLAFELADTAGWGSSDMEIAATAAWLAAHRATLGDIDERSGGIYVIDVTGHEADGSVTGGGELSATVEDVDGQWLVVAWSWTVSDLDSGSGSASTPTPAAA